MNYALRTLAAIGSLIAAWWGIAAATGHLIMVVWAETALALYDGRLAPLPTLPDTAMVRQTVAASVAAFLLALLLANRLLPLRGVAQRMLRQPCTELQDHAQIVLNVHAVIEASNHNAQPTVQAPRVLLVNDHRHYAMALASPTRTAIALSTGLLRDFPGDEAVWVIAHQASRLRDGSARITAFWLTALDLLRTGRYLRNTIMRIFVHNEPTRLPTVMLDVLLFPLGIFNLLTGLVELLARVLFRALDVFFVVDINQRADSEAARLAGAQAGHAVLARLPQGIDPPLSLFARYGAEPQRLAAISVLAATQQPDLPHGARA